MFGEFLLIVVALFICVVLIPGVVAHPMGPIVGSASCLPIPLYTIVVLVFMFSIFFLVALAVTEYKMHGLYDVFHL